uniref:Uncharacterized protein n=1 Tax=Anthurium amnicola TaxID=1678845 RepID=A0A1D1XCW1_9ARAE
MPGVSEDHQQQQQQQHQQQQQQRRRRRRYGAGALHPEKPPKIRREPLSDHLRPGGCRFLQAGRPDADRPHRHRLQAPPGSHRGSPLSQEPGPPGQDRPQEAGVQAVRAPARQLQEPQGHRPPADAGRRGFLPAEAVAAGDPVAERAGLPGADAEQPRHPADPRPLRPPAAPRRGLGGGARHRPEGVLPAPVAEGHARGLASPSAAAPVPRHLPRRLLPRPLLRCFLLIRTTSSCSLPPVRPSPLLPLPINSVCHLLVSSPRLVAVIAILSLFSEMELSTVHRRCSSLHLTI